MKKGGKQSPETVPLNGGNDKLAKKTSAHLLHISEIPNPVKRQCHEILYHRFFHLSEQL